MIDTLPKSSNFTIYPVVSPLNEFSTIILAPNQQNLQVNEAAYVRFDQLTGTVHPWLWPLVKQGVNDQTLPQ